MKAVVFKQHGGPEVLEYTTVPDPKPARGEVLIEVKAASRWTERDLAGLRAFLEQTPRCRAAVLGYNGEHSVRLGDKLWAIPLHTLLS